MAFWKRQWRSVFEYVQSELMYSSMPPTQSQTTSPQQKPQTQSDNEQRPESPTTVAPKPPPDPQLLSHFQQRERVYAFIRVPLLLEKFVLFAFWLCVDTFLNMFTFLPVRLVFCAFKFLSRAIGIFFNWKTTLSPAQRCDFLRGVVVFFCSLIIYQLDISVFYHLIRSQSIIKLYIFFNMLEIAEKLMTSVGQDIMDALFITATEHAFHKSKSRHLVLLFHVFLAIIYSCIHTLIFTLQTVTLNVAFNSQNKSLLTVMMSNNFVEIKSNVFRKYSRNNLYQVACYDAKERFHLLIMMGMVALRNTAQFNWQLDHLMALLPDMAIVLTVEVFVDWIKHCFITKFNETPSDLYVDLRKSLARHVLTASVVTGGADRQDTVANRTGLSLVPLTSLVIVIGMQALRSTDWDGPGPLLLLGLIILMFVLKSILGCIVIAAARSIVSEQKPVIQSQTVTRVVSSSQGRSFSVENVKLESSGGMTKAASTLSLASKFSSVNSTVKTVTNKENVETVPAKLKDESMDFSDLNQKTLPALTLVRNSWPSNELRRSRSLTTIPESPIPTTGESQQQLTQRKGNAMPETPPKPVLQLSLNPNIKSAKVE